MEVLYERCCGLDIHKDTVVACVMITPANGRMKKTIRTFGTTTAEILALRDWIDEQQVSHIALESTGIFWRPLYNLLEDGHTIILVNAHHMKAVPGRKTDVKDSEWIADLLRHGLRKREFHPTQADPRGARSHAIPQEFSLHADGRNQPPPESLGNR